MTFHADRADSQVLAHFDHHGVGVVNYLNGNPWLVVSKTTWTLSRPNGRIQRTAKFPETATEPIICEVGEHLVVQFISRWDITATFSCEDVVLKLQCGEKLRRTDTYLDKVTGRKVGGPLQLDMGPIRQRQKEVGSLYIPRGPHHYVTPAPGVGILRTLVKALPPTCELLPTISDLDSTQTRLKTMSRPPTALAAPLSLTSRSTSSLGATSSSTSSSLSSTSRGLEDFGSPPLSSTQRRLKATLKFDPTKSYHKPRRLKLKTMGMLEVEQRVKGGGAPQDTLVLLCLLADWSPVCHKLEGQLGGAHFELQEQAAADPTGPAAHVQMFKVDASEGRSLQQQYGFRTVPMFLMVFEGRLVGASNDLRTQGQVVAGALEALDRGRRGVFLPEGFSFQGVGNCMLDTIKPEMSLLYAS